MSGFVLGAILTTAGSVSADPQPPVLEEVIVTAERRESKLQETAISISVITGEALTQQGVETSMDLQRLTPSLIFGATAGFGQPYIRGIGNEHLTIAADSSTSVYVDGVYFARAGGSLQGLFDLERVEILKGPQGTLYGRNSVGGSINFITRKPSPDPGFHTDVILGNNDKRSFRGSFNLPATNNLFIRGSGIAGKSSGFFTDLGNDSDRYGGEDFKAWRLGARYLQIDDVEMTLSVDYSRDKTERTGVFSHIQGFLSPAVDFDRDVPNTGLPGPLDIGATPGRVNSDPHQNFLNSSPIEDQEQSGANLTVNWDLDFATLVSISAHRKFYHDAFFDLDGTDYPDGEQQMFMDTSTQTQEFQLVSNPSASPLQWVAGLFYLNDGGVQRVGVSLASGQQLVDFDAELDTWAWAGFGQVSYDVMDDVRLTAGLRYSKEQKEVIYDHTIVIFPGAMEIMIPIGLRDSASWSSWDPKFGIEYRANDDIMLYANASKGFKSGGFNNLSLDTTSQRFKPEEVLAYEAGLKSSLVAGRVFANVAAFYYDYTELQQNQYDAEAVVVVNADSAVIIGVEADVTARLTEEFKVNLAVSFLDATFEKFLTYDPDDVAAGSQNLGGNRLPRAPEWAYNVNMLYEQDLNEFGRVTWFADYAWKAEVFHSPFNQDGIGQGSFGLASARITWRAPNDVWSASIWGKNLGDEAWLQNSIRNTSFAGAIGLAAAPRTYGVTLSAEW